MNSTQYCCYLRLLGLVGGKCEKNQFYAEYGDLACDHHSKHLEKIDAQKTGYATYAVDNRCNGITTGMNGGRRCPESKAHGYDFCTIHIQKSNDRIQMYRAVGDYICHNIVPMDWESSSTITTSSFNGSEASRNSYAPNFQPFTFGNYVTSYPSLSPSQSVRPPVRPSVRSSVRPSVRSSVRPSVRSSIVPSFSQIDWKKFRF